MISDGINKSTDKLFINQIKIYDLVLLTETHIGYNTNIEITDFTYYPVCRDKSSNNRYFGGLGILVKRNIRKGISILPNTNKDYQWLMLKKDFFNLKKKTFIYVLHIYLLKCQVITKKLDVETLEHIEQDIFNKYGNSGDIILTGDFNARTGNKLDYITGDSASHIPVK